MKPQLVTSATVFVSHSVPPSCCPNDPAFTLRSITRPVIHSNGSKKKEMRTIIQYMTGRGLLTLPLPEFVLHLPFLIDIWMFRLGVKWVRFGRPTLWLSICVFHFVLSAGYTKNEISARDDDQSVELLIARWEEKRRTPALGCLCIYLCHMLFCFRQMRPLSCPNDFAFPYYYQLPWNSNIFLDDRYTGYFTVPLPESIADFLDCSPLALLKTRIGSGPSHGLSLGDFGVFVFSTREWQMMGICADTAWPILMETGWPLSIKQDPNRKTTGKQLELETWNWNA